MMTTWCIKNMLWYTCLLYRAQIKIIPNHHYCHCLFSMFKSSSFIHSPSILYKHGSVQGKLTSLLAICVEQLQTYRSFKLSPIAYSVLTKRNLGHTSISTMSKGVASSHTKAMHYTTIIPSF